MQLLMLNMHHSVELYIFVVSSIYFDIYQEIRYQSMTIFFPIKHNRIVRGGEELVCVVGLLAWQNLEGTSYSDIQTAFLAIRKCLLR